MLTPTHASYTKTLQDGEGKVAQQLLGGHYPSIAKAIMAMSDIQIACSWMPCSCTHAYSVHPCTYILYTAGTHVCTHPHIEGRPFKHMPCVSGTNTEMFAGLMSWLCTRIPE